MMLINCEITVENNILCFEMHNALQNTQNIRFSLEISEKNWNLINQIHFADLEILNSIIPQDLEICGIFRYVKIENCTNSFILDSNVINLVIKNQQYPIYIKNYGNDFSAEIVQHLLSNKQWLIEIKNSQINTLQNLQIDTLTLENSMIKNIKSVQCKNLIIANTECAFILKRDQKKQKFSDVQLNMKISHQQYMVMDEYHVNEN